MRRPVRVVGLGFVVVVLAACGSTDDSPAPTDGCRQAEDGRVTIVAVDLAWDTDCLVAPADEPLTIVVDNQDAGVNHNIRLRDAPGQPKTPLEAGPIRQELEVTLPVGAYTYICDIHPNMLGTLQAEAVVDAYP